MRCCHLKRQARCVVVLIAAAVLVTSAAGVPRAAARVASDTGAEAKKKPTDPGPLLAVVSLARQRISLYGRGGLIAQSPVSTGMPGHRTPAGVFSVIQKSKFHRSNIYWNAPMPYMQRITWSGVTLHAGPVPGYPASHGCIRLPPPFAVRLYGMSKIGTRIVIVPGDAAVLGAEPLELPAPRLSPALPDASATGENARSELVTRANLAPGAEASAKAPPAPTPMLNPVERAKLMRDLAATNATAKSKVAKKAVEISAGKAAAASSAAAALRASESALNLARGRRSTAAKAVERASATMTAQADHGLAVADLRLAEAEKANEEARALEAAEAATAVAAAKVASDAEQASREATAALKAAERGIEPISILVSKKTGRLYVRQSWAPIYEAAITFKDPAQSLGTQVYLAVASEASGESMRWLSLSLPAARQAERRGAKPLAAAEPVVAHAQSSQASRETTTSVLDRFQLSDEAKSFIAERLWIGASLIVTDEGISNETNTYTDFIVLTR